MTLYEIAKENQELLNDGIMSLVVYKEGRSWKYKELYCCDFVEGEGFEWNFDEESQRQEVINIMNVDSNAIIINGYDSAFVQGSVRKICEGLKYAYENNWGLLSNERESILNGNSNLNIKTEPTEEDTRASLILDLISDKDSYSNEDKACICSRCEIKSMCNYADKFQRLEREQGGLGLCHKLNRFIFYDFVESHLEEYKLIIDTRREKRNYIEVELLKILQQFDNQLLYTSYKIHYHEEYLNIRYVNKSVKLCITATNLEGIKKLVHEKILKPKLLEAWQSVKDSFSAVQNFYDMYYCYGEQENEYQELYNMTIDEYDDTMELLKLYNEDFYNYIDDLKSFRNSYDRCIESAIYCIENKCVPKEIV